MKKKLIRLFYCIVNAHTCVCAAAVEREKFLSPQQRAAMILLLLLVSRVSTRLFLPKS
jgi:hypothetical protein